MKTAAPAAPVDPLTRDLVALHRGLVLFPSPAAAPADSDGARLAASLQAELMNLGFALDSAAFAAAAAAATPRDWLVAYHHEIIGHLRMRLGAGRPYRPFYLNFPAQVMEMSHLELFINAIGHYWSGGTWEPPQVLRDRGFAFEDVRFKTLRPGTDADLLAGFTAMVSANGSLTEQDKQVVAWMIDQYAGRLTLPAEVPFKETLCLLAAKGLDVPIKTPTDVLRIAVYMSGGDVSLPGVPKPVKGGLPPEAKRNRHLRQYVDQLRAARIAARDKFKFKKFTRADRRRLLAFLEKTSCDVTEMQRHLGRWLRLGEVLHPGELAAKFPRAAEAFRVLRNQRKGTRVRTWAARVDLAFAANWHEGLELLATRPGELARRLDWLLRTYDRGPVLAAFERVADRVS
ncbi:MAG TPA: hypothetical protein VK986_21540, partial [Tepidisphaeraceae bacterium]|nr:hypothetical protein [Tepidisphaeraceae bacterium]